MVDFSNYCGLLLLLVLQELNLKYERKCFWLFRYGFLTLQSHPHFPSQTLIPMSRSDGIGIMAISPCCFLATVSEFLLEFHLVWEKKRSSPFTQVSLSLATCCRKMVPLPPSTHMIVSFRGLPAASVQNWESIRLL